MQFVANKEESEKEQSDSALDKMKRKGQVVKCRICKEDHWTTQCPYKDTLGPLRESLTGPVEGEGGPEGAAAGGAAAAAAPAAGAGGKYVPPSRRGGDNSSAQSRISGDSMMPDKRREDTAAIRISNLSENAQETDLQVCFNVTKLCFIILYFSGTFQTIWPHCQDLPGQGQHDWTVQGVRICKLLQKGRRKQGHRNFERIWVKFSFLDVSNFILCRYDHLILSVEWAKPALDR